MKHSDLADINRSIMLLEDAICLTPEGHPQKPSHLNRLNQSLCGVTATFTALMILQLFIVTFHWLLIHQQDLQQFNFLLAQHGHYLLEHSNIPLSWKLTKLPLSFFLSWLGLVYL
jgi:hypothetical protein